MPVSENIRPLWGAAAALWRREVLRFVRQRSRIVGALGTPLVFWIVIGSGLRHSFAFSVGAPGDFLRYSFPGILVLIVLFTCIFSMISIIEDRREGFMQGVLAAPVPRSAIVLGKILGSTSLALMQSLLFLVLAPAAGVSLSIASVAGAILVLIFVSFSLGALGFLLAWPMESTQGFHAVMNLFLMPMWLLSGAFFPQTGASTWVRAVMAVNPLSYGVSALRRVLDPDSAASAAAPPLALSLGITIIMMLVLVVLATRAVNRNRGLP